MSVLSGNILYCEMWKNTLTSLEKLIDDLVQNIYIVYITSETLTCLRSDQNG